MKTGKFKQRDLQKKPVTYVVDRDYEKSDKRSLRYIRSIIEKIMPDPNDMDILLMILASAMTGDSTKDQFSLFFLGEGSNGKSLLMEVMKVGFDEYILELGSDTFIKGNQKRDKILNSLIIHKYVRKAWVNEFNEGQIDGPVYKAFMDGKLHTCSLFADGMNAVYHEAKLVSTANMFPSMVLDGGTKRRTEGITGYSKFVDTEDEVDEDNHIYLKDKTILSKIAADTKLIIDLIVEYTVKMHEGETIDLHKNKNMVETRARILNSNDNMTDFVDSQLVRTKNEKDKISKEDMHERFKEFKPKSLITLKQFIAALNQIDEKIGYGERQRNSSGTRGGWYGVKFKDSDDNVFDDDNTESDDDAFDKGVDKSDKRIHANPFLQGECDKYKKKCEQLQAKVKELEKLLKKDDSGSESESEDEKPAVKAKVAKKKITPKKENRS
jgi:hypothetical protein